MITEYLEQVRGRLNAAVRADDRKEVNRLDELMRMVMIDAGKSGEKMPWDKVCPCCGTVLATDTSTGDGNG